MSVHSQLSISLILFLFFSLSHFALVKGRRLLGLGSKYHRLDTKVLILFCEMHLKPFQLSGLPPEAWLKLQGCWVSDSDHSNLDICFSTAKIVSWECFYLLMNNVHRTCFHVHIHFPHAPFILPLSSSPFNTQEIPHHTSRASLPACKRRGQPQQCYNVAWKKEGKGA